MKKRIVSVLLVAAMTLSMVTGCSNNNKKQDGNKKEKEKNNIYGTGLGSSNR